MPPRPPWAVPGPPLGRPLPAPVGFCFLLAPVAVGFFAFFGVLLVPLGSRVCVRGIRALYNAQGGRGRAPGGWDGAGGATSALPCLGEPGTPHPHACPCTPRLPLDQMWGQQGHGGGIWDYTCPPPSQHPLPAPCAPPGHPTRPRPPHVTSRQVSSPQRDPRRGGGTGLPGPLWSPWPCPPPPCPGHLPPTPCQHSDCMSLPLTDGQCPPTLHPVLCPLLPSTVFIPLVCAWCDVSLRLCPVQGRVFSALPPPAPCA